MVVTHAKLRNYTQTFITHRDIKHGKVFSSSKLLKNKTRRLSVPHILHKTYKYMRTGRQERGREEGREKGGGEKTKMSFAAFLLSCFPFFGPCGGLSWLWYPSHTPHIPQRGPALALPRPSCACADLPSTCGTTSPGSPSGSRTLGTRIVTERFH